MRWALFIATLAASAAWADTRTDFYERPIDFALHIGEGKTALAYANRSVDTTVQRIGARWQEHYGTRLRLAMRGGYSFVTQTGNDATAGLELDGYHAALAFDVDLFRRQRFKLYAGGTYLYERAKEETAGQRIELSWHEPTGRIGAVVGLGRDVELRAGVRHGYIAGAERLRGTINKTMGVGRRHATGAFVGLQLTVDANGGYVGVSGHGGIERGAAVYFGRRF